MSDRKPIGFSHKEQHLSMLSEIAFQAAQSAMSTYIAEHCDSREDIGETKADKDESDINVIMGIDNRMLVRSSDTEPITHKLCNLISTYKKIAEDLDVQVVKYIQEIDHGNYSHVEHSSTVSEHCALVQKELNKYQSLLETIERFNAILNS